MLLISIIAGINNRTFAVNKKLMLEGILVNADIWRLILQRHQWRYCRLGFDWLGIFTSNMPNCKGFQVSATRGIFGRSNQ